MTALTKIRKTNVTDWVPEPHSVPDIGRTRPMTLYGGVEPTNQNRVIGLSGQGWKVDQYATIISTHPDCAHLSPYPVDLFATGTCINPMPYPQVQVIGTGGLGSHIMLTLVGMPVTHFDTCSYSQLRPVENSTVPRLINIDLDLPADPLIDFEQYAQANWDGTGAEAITPETLAYARQLLRVMPQTFGEASIAPAAAGAVALEWVPENHHKLDRLFLDIGPGQQWRAYWLLRDGTYDRLTGSGYTPSTRHILSKLFDDLNQP